jgi:hypothetical protein
VLSLAIVSNLWYSLGIGYHFVQADMIFKDDMQGFNIVFDVVVRLVSFMHNYESYFNIIRFNV